MLIREIEIELSLEDIFRRYSKEAGFSFLDSSLQKYGIGDFSVLCCHPWKSLTYDSGVAVVEEFGLKREVKGDPFLILKEESVSYEESSALPFVGGAIGYIGYDVARYYEKIPNRSEKLKSGYEMRFRYYDAGLCFDHRSDKLYAFASERVPNANELLAKQVKLAEEAASMAGDSDPYGVGPLKSNFTVEGYVTAVDEIRECIRRGEVYQVNLSQRFSASFRGDVAALYHNLRKLSPAPYGAYLDFGDEVILSNSPEQFLQSKGTELVTRPIKGTRPRGGDNAEDEQMKQSLINSQKDRSELLMIVDLERNDMGRVCSAGSVQVKDLFAIEAYSNVFHQTAKIEGKLAGENTALDGIKALFPGGSITGAPKIKAMEVIDYLEPVRRGVYTGSIGFIGNNGELDFNIAIRTLRVSDGELQFNVGGGIVWDSDAKSEYEETLAKGRSMMKALSVGELVV
ncbi:aminodeoxychorismate synthase component I [Puniceicoccaceae bacterium K14]|nr:aminodeoxychorismate synthase component I [Puniceicoccaceae bacterium K14]